MTNDAAEEWRQQPDDPDSAQDLGYRLDDWERIEAQDAESEKYLYLPEDEELLREEMFLVVAPGDVVDLENRR